MPSAAAKREEVEALLAIGREFNVGSVEVTPEDISLGEPEIRMLERFSELSGRPAIHTALFHSNHKPEAYKHALQHLEAANQRGYRVFALGGIVRIGSLFNLIEYNLFDDMPAWNKALACPLEQRLNAGRSLRNGNLDAAGRTRVGVFDSRALAKRPRGQIGGERGIGGRAKSGGMARNRLGAEFVGMAIPAGLWPGKSRGGGEKKQQHASYTIAFDVVAGAVGVRGLVRRGKDAGRGTVSRGAR